MISPSRTDTGLAEIMAIGAKMARTAIDVDALRRQPRRLDCKDTLQSRVDRVMKLQYPPLLRLSRRCADEAGDFTAHLGFVATATVKF